MKQKEGKTPEEWRQLDSQLFWINSLERELWDLMERERLNGRTKQTEVEFEKMSEKYSRYLIVY